MSNRPPPASHSGFEAMIPDLKMMKTSVPQLPIASEEHNRTAQARRRASGEYGCCVVMSSRARRFVAKLFGVKFAVGLSFSIGIAPVLNQAT